MSKLLTLDGDAAFFCISLFRNIAIVDVAGAIDEPRTCVRWEQAFLLLHREFGDVGVLAIIRVDRTDSLGPMLGLMLRVLSRRMVSALRLVAMVVEDSGLVMQLFVSLARGINFVAGRSRINVFPHLMAAEAGAHPLDRARQHAGRACLAVRESRGGFATFSPGSAA